jgi:exo-beta-1,3-glucanase (GH17 family)
MRAVFDDRMKTWGAAFLAVTLLALGAWWWQGRAVSMVDAPTDRLPCVSYAPFRGAETPFDESYVASPERIEEDLSQLAAISRCVRTYSIDQGLDQVPAIAERLGLKVMLGVWIGRDNARNAAEIERAVALAHAYPETIRMIVVGNEVLLRREQPAAELARLIGQVRSSVSVPVTYADVWEFWLAHPELASAVDVATIHTLPYWEDHPVAIDGAIDHVIATWKDVAARMPDTPVMIGEAGWPRAGRMREGAKPSIVNQARFVRELLAKAVPLGIDVNLIEAFDQPWKRGQEGTVGGNWGLFGSDRQPTFPLTGPVAADPHWPVRFAAATLMALTLTVLTGLRGWRFGILGWLAVAGLSHLIGAGLVLAVDQLQATSRAPLDWALGFGRLTLAALSVLALLVASPDPTHRKPLVAPFGMLLGRAHIRTLLGRAYTRRHAPDGPMALAFSLLRFLIVVGAASTALALVFDPRYRDFPTAVFAVPAIALAVLAWLERERRRVTARTASDDRREEGLLALVLVLSAAAIVVREGWDNVEALAFAATLVVLAVPLGLDWVAGYRDHRRAAVDRRTALQL